MSEALLYFTQFGWLPAVLLLAGIAFLIVEMFVPGFGVPGILGLICIVLGVIFKARTITEAMLLLLAIILVLASAFMLLLRSARSGRLAKSAFVLHAAATKEDGFTSADELTYFIGRKGTTLTVLRPAGSATFDGVRLDVVSEGDFIDKGTDVVVSKVEGRRIVVVAAPKESA